MTKKISEIWKDIAGYEGYYQVINTGRVKSLTRKIANPGCYSGTCIIRERILKPGLDVHGYYFVNLCKDKSQRSFMIHKLVATAFIPNPESKPQVNHIDFNTKNNNLSNLEWVTARENGQHSSVNHKKKIIIRELNGTIKTVLKCQN